MANESLLTDEERHGLYGYNNSIRNFLIPTLDAIKDCPYAVGDVLCRYHLRSKGQDRSYNYRNPSTKEKKKYKVVHIDSYGLVFVKTFGVEGRLIGRPMCITTPNVWIYEHDDDFLDSKLLGLQDNTAEVVAQKIKKDKENKAYNQTLEVTISGQDQLRAWLRKRIGQTVYFRMPYRRIFASLQIVNVDRYTCEFKDARNVDDWYYFRGTTVALDQLFHCIFFKERPRGTDETC